MARRRHSYHVVLAPIVPLGPRRLLSATVANTPSESPSGFITFAAAGRFRSPAFPRRETDETFFIHIIFRREMEQTFFSHTILQPTFS